MDECGLYLDNLPIQPDFDIGSPKEVKQLYYCDSCEKIYFGVPNSRKLCVDCDNNLVPFSSYKPNKD